MTSDSHSRVGEQRPGGRAARVRADVLRAAVEILNDVGYDGLSYDAVARRAGVHRTTVYRRWPSKPDLVADAVGLVAEDQIPVPDTGDLVADLLVLARSVAATIGSVGGARRSRSIVAAAASSQELASATHGFMERRIELCEPIVRRAVARGELSEGIDPRAVLEPVVGALWFRLLLTGEPIDHSFAEEVAALVGAGARSVSRAGADGGQAGVRAATAGKKAVSASTSASSCGATTSTR